ncbi:hypothetical protein ACOME3_008844 [Neoechinorhynchus agilis]
MAVSIETRTNYGSRQKANDESLETDIIDIDRKKIAGGRKRCIVKSESKDLKSRKRSKNNISSCKRSSQVAQITESTSQEQSPSTKRVAVSAEQAVFRPQRKVAELPTKTNPSILDSSLEDASQPTGLSQGFSVDVPYIYRLRYDTDQRKIDEIQQNITELCPVNHGGGFIGSQQVSMTVNNVETLWQLSYRESYKADGTRYLLFIRE